jgi:hypothetical protein
MIDEHEFTIETRETPHGTTYFAICSCGWEGKRSSFELARMRGIAHTLQSQVPDESKDQPTLEADPDAGETEYDPEPIELSDAFQVITWLQGRRVRAFHRVGDHARSSISGPLQGGRTQSAGGIRVRVETRSMSASFEVSNEQFVSAVIVASVMNIEFSQSRITLAAPGMQEAWRHVQISKRWLAEQPPNDATDPSPDAARSRRIGYQ